MQCLRSVFFLGCMLFTRAAFAAIELPSFIGDHMVLQRETHVPLWGKARAGARVTLTSSWNRKTYTTQADAAGNWKVMIQTPAAGGPYQITCNDGTPLILTDVLIGEVWLASGQSNMEMPVAGFRNQPVLNSNDLLMESGNPEIRLCQLEHGAVLTPASAAKSTGWQQSDAQMVKKFSAVAYQYAKILQERLRVPVGIIGSYWGGTIIEAWMNTHSLQAFPHIRIPRDTVGTGKNTATALFNAMICPLVGYGIKGVIWYQGEQNRPSAAIYDSLLLAMVKEWRTLWNQGEWPFYYVQIAPYRYNDKLGPSAPLREAQQKAAAIIPHCGMVVSMDAGEEKTIHPANKTVISRRLAYWALANTYGRPGIAFESPVYKSMKVEDNGSVTVLFDHAPNGLTAFGKELAAFELAGSDQQFYPATATITGQGVRLSSGQVKSPVAVRYAFKDWVTGDLYNTEGLPAAPFRTDTWEIK
ncbi:MAG: sialate O-acetylesterase [Williamsia sp.]|nr:sialate O-acetylesterase [Williamsia sp.]